VTARSASPSRRRGGKRSGEAIGTLERIFS
jgi:hypothetical protein